MNKMMRWWAGRACKATVNVFYPPRRYHRTVFYGFGWIFVLMAWHLVKWSFIWLLWCLFVALNVAQLVVGLVLWPFVLLARPLGRKWHRMIDWYTYPLTTDEVEQWFSYYC